MEINFADAKFFLYKGKILQIELFICTNFVKLY